MCARSARCAAHLFASQPCARTSAAGANTKARTKRTFILNAAVLIWCKLLLLFVRALETERARDTLECVRQTVSFQKDGQRGRFMSRGSEALKSNKDGQLINRVAVVLERIAKCNRRTEIDSVFRRTPRGGAAAPCAAAALHSACALYSMRTCCNIAMQAFISQRASTSGPCAVAAAAERQLGASATAAALFLRRAPLPPPPAAAAACAANATTTTSSSSTRYASSIPGRSKPQRSRATASAAAADTAAAAAGAHPDADGRYSGSDSAALPRFYCPELPPAGARSLWVAISWGGGTKGYRGARACLARVGSGVPMGWCNVRLKNCDCRPSHSRWPLPEIFARP